LELKGRWGAKIRTPQPVVFKDGKKGERDICYGGDLKQGVKKRCYFERLKDYWEGEWERVGEREGGTADGQSRQEDGVV